MLPVTSTTMIAASAPSAVVIPGGQTLPCATARYVSLPTPSTWRTSVCCAKGRTGRHLPRISNSVSHRTAVQLFSLRSVAMRFGSCFLLALLTSVADSAWGNTAPPYVQRQDVVYGEV